MPVAGKPSISFEYRVLELDEAGSLLDTHIECAGIGHERGGFAVDLSREKMFLTSEFNGSKVYAIAEVPLPDASLLPVVDLDAFSASFVGEVSPGGPPSVECRFDYAPKSDFESVGFVGASQLPCDQVPGTGTDPVAVGGQTGSLSPNTDYVVRLVAVRRVDGKLYGVAAASGLQEFTTGPEPPPTVITGAVAPRGENSARLTGFANPNSNATEVQFEYGTSGPCSSNPCSNTPLEAIGAAYIPPGEPFIDVTAEIDELVPGTVYHYRLVGSNVKGTTSGEDRVFTTLAPVPECPNADVRREQGTDGYLGNCRGLSSSIHRTRATPISAWLGPFRWNRCPRSTLPERLRFG